MNTKTPANQTEPFGISSVAKGFAAMLFAIMVAMGTIQIMDGKKLGWFWFFVGLLYVYSFASGATSRKTQERKSISKFFIVASSLGVVLFLLALLGTFFDLL